MSREHLELADMCLVLSVIVLSVFYLSACGPDAPLKEDSYHGLGRIRLQLASMCPLASVV